MPPRYEGFPLVLLEALALGVPVIASPSGRDLLDEGAYGIIVPAESPENLASAIERHPRDLLSLRTLAERGPEHARRYNWTAVATRHLAWLGELAGRAPDLTRPGAGGVVLSTVVPHRLISAAFRGPAMGPPTVLNGNVQRLTWRTAGTGRRSRSSPPGPTLAIGKL
jgi:hypothetical protein